MSDDKRKESKIKEKSDKVKLQPLFMLFFFGSLAGIVLRTLQMAKYIDVETGFTTGGGFTFTVLYAVLLILGLVFCIVSYLSAESARLNISGVKNKNMGIGALIFAVSLFYDGLDQFFSAFLSVGAVSQSDYRAFMTAGTIPMLLQSFFAFFGGIFLIIVSKDLFKGTFKASKRRVIATAPVWWAGARLIHRFVRQISFVEVSDLLLELCMLAFMILFFMAFAQVTVGIYSDGFRWRIIGMGLSASLIALTLSVPRLIFTFVNGGAFINPDHTFYITDLAFAVFAVILLLSFKKSKASYTGQQNTNETTGE